MVWKAASVPERARAVWRKQLGSAYRTAMACSIVGCATLYGPQYLRGQVPFPAFSYLTAILIVTNATLGDTLRGCWHALYATLLVLPPSILSLWVIGPARFSAGGAALAVAVGAFLVAVPESSSMMSKRIAFGQLVIVYVGAVIHGQHAEAVIFMRPAHLAANTALGALASLLALLLPYPWLAFCEVRKLLELYTENASERTSLFMKAFVSENNPTADDLICQTKPFAETGARLLHRIKLVQEGVRWERPHIRDFKPHFINAEDKLEDMETAMRGMEMALTSIPSFPVGIMDEELSSVWLGAQVQLGLKLEQATACFLPFDATTVPERKVKLYNMSLQSLPTISPHQKHFPSFFFLSCLELLLTNSTITLKPESLLHDHNPLTNTEDQAKFSFKRLLHTLINVTPSKKSLVFAFKCSLALGLAVLLGLIFNKEQGYWSGLTIAITFATGKQATFTLANARVQGTALGSVYGVLGCFIFHKFTEIRFVTLLPWIIFTSFLRHSKMYGQAGGISAVIGAILILGRRNYGQPNEFAITRLTEASIGLLCLITVELLLQPVRAATLSKQQVSQCLGTLRQCIHQIVLSSTQKEKGPLIFLALRENQRKLKSNLKDLKKFIGDAESEPDFWFLPFRASCYNKLHGSLSKMVDLLDFMVYSMEFLLQVSQRYGVAWRELQQHMNSDLELLKDNINPCLKRLERITLIKSIASFEQQLHEEKRVHDLESGKPHSSNVLGVSTTWDDTANKIINSFLQYSKEVIDKIQTTEVEEEFKGKTILHLNSLGFCISGLIRETMEVEKGIKNLVRWENPSSRVEFYELCYKIDAMCS